MNIDEAALTAMIKKLVEVCDCGSGDKNCSVCRRLCIDLQTAYLAALPPAQRRWAIVLPSGALSRDTYCDKEVAEVMRTLGYEHIAEIEIREVRAALAKAGGTS